MRLLCRLACTALTGVVLLGPTFGTPALAQSDTAQSDTAEAPPPVASIAREPSGDSTGNAGMAGTAAQDVGALLLMTYPSGSAKMTFLPLAITGNGLMVTTRSRQLSAHWGGACSGTGIAWRERRR